MVNQTNRLLQISVCAVCWTFLLEKKKLVNWMRRFSSKEEVISFIFHGGVCLHEGGHSYCAMETSKQSDLRRSAEFDSFSYLEGWERWGAIKISIEPIRLRDQPTHAFGFWLPAPFCHAAEKKAQTLRYQDTRWGNDGQSPQRGSSWNTHRTADSLTEDLCSKRTWSQFDKSKYESETISCYMVTWTRHVDHGAWV